jgi:hypothetical protein
VRGKIPEMILPDYIDNEIEFLKDNASGFFIAESSLFRLKILVAAWPPSLRFFSTVN